VEGRATPSGWYTDPWRRSEYRYFNGVQWTSDVAIDGQRYVDLPTQPHAPQPASPTASRGLAVTSFVTAAAAVLLGWVPFIFVLAACAAIAAIVFGLLGLGAARRQVGQGRGFAVAGLALSPVALAVCVGGFFFTTAVLRDFNDLVEPGPFELAEEQPCTADNGRVTFRGTIRNLDDRARDYRIVVEISNAGEQAKVTMVRVPGVGPGQTEQWSSSAIASSSSVVCRVTDVLGPLPFVDEQS